VLERLCAEVIVRSERHLFETLTTDLSDGQRHELDTLLKLRAGSKVSTLRWLRSPPGSPTSQNILLHIERLQHIRNLELRSDLDQLIHQNRLLQLAREGAATTPQHIARFDDPRRYGTLVAVLLEASSTLTDEILDLHDRFVGSIFNKARRRRDEAFQSSGKAINEKVRLYARIGQALLAAKENGADQPMRSRARNRRSSDTPRGNFIPLRLEPTRPRCTVMHWSIFEMKREYVRLEWMTSALRR
jgi:hypothetical protein